MRERKDNSEGFQQARQWQQEKGERGVQWRGLMGWGKRKRERGYDKVEEGEREGGNEDWVAMEGGRQWWQGAGSGEEREFFLNNPGISFYCKIIIFCHVNIKFNFKMSCHHHAEVFDRKIMPETSVNLEIQGLNENKSKISNLKVVPHFYMTVHKLGPILVFQPTSVENICKGLNLSFLFIYLFILTRSWIFAPLYSRGPAPALKLDLRDIENLLGNNRYAGWLNELLSLAIAASRQPIHI